MSEHCEVIKVRDLDWYSAEASADAHADRVDVAHQITLRDMIERPGSGRKNFAMPRCSAAEQDRRGKDRRGPNAQERVISQQECNPSLALSAI